MVFDRRTKKEVWSEISYHPEAVPKRKLEVIKRRLRKWGRKRRDLLHKLSKHIVDIAIDSKAK